MFLLRLPGLAVDRFVDFWFRRVDSRPYALVRIGLAAIVLWAWTDMFGQRMEHFSVDGMVIGLSEMPVGEGTKPSINLLAGIDDPTSVNVFFGCGLVAALALGVGFLTPLSALAVFLYEATITHQAYAVMVGYDTLLKVLAFVLIFSPVSRRWSVDGWLLARWRPGWDLDRVAVYGLRLIQIQIAVMYLTTFWLKIFNDSWRNGEFLYYVWLSHYSRVPPEIAVRLDGIISAIFSFASLFIECFVAVFLCFPATRLAAFVAGWGFHLSIGLTTTVELFSGAAMVGYFAFLSGADIDWLRAQVVSARNAMSARPR